MQEKLLGEIIEKIIGKQAREVVGLLMGKRDVNEFLIAKKLNLTINQVRNLLYKMANFGLVTFTRKKDKRKGWYTYFWTLEIKKSLELLDRTLKKDTEELQNQLKSRENKRFYLCRECVVEVSEETAMLHDFTCQECGKVYELNEDKKIVKELRNRTERLERQRKEVLEEIGKIKEVEVKKLKRKTESAKIKKKHKKIRLKKKRKKRI